MQQCLPQDGNDKFGNNLNGWRDDATWQVRTLGDLSMVNAQKTGMSALEMNKSILDRSDECVMLKSGWNRSAMHCS